MIFWKDPIDISIQSYSDGHIDSLIQHLDKKWRFTGFYGHPESYNRNQSWELLRRLKEIHELKELPWLVGGDFNEICFDTEKKGGNPRLMKQTRAFRDVLDDCSLQDLNGSGDLFTWVNRRSKENLIFERLDRYVGSVTW